MAEPIVNNKNSQIVRPVGKVITPSEGSKNTEKPVEELTGIFEKQPSLGTKSNSVPSESKVPVEIEKYTSDVFHHAKTFGDPLMLDTIRLLPRTEYFIMALHLGLINGKNYSINAIASFLEMGNEAVRKVITNGLENYKNAINDSIQNEINVIYKSKSLINK